MQVAQLILRKATLEDAETLFSWRNDPETRMNSLCSEEIDLAKHHSWLKNALTQQSRQLFIAEINAEPVGTVRADRQDNSTYWLISWTVAPRFRAKGIGAFMVQKLLKFIKAPVEAHVKKNNIASQKIALQSGLELITCENDILIYRSHQKKISK